mgnify:CR=1 FL=1
MEISNQQMMHSNNMNIVDAKLQQERYEEYRLSKIRIAEHNQEKIVLDKLMLEAYWAKLEQLATYNQQAQLKKAQADLGKIIDIEV